MHQDSYVVHLRQGTLPGGLVEMQTEMEAKLEFRCHIPKDDSAKLGVQRNMIRKLG
uniref:Uncharacterized protein n=1 Tax=viral metagenome TaxID=1070528 RepID=A0A6C0HVR2_9ZZZZ